MHLCAWVFVCASVRVCVCVWVCVCVCVSSPHWASGYWATSVVTMISQLTIADGRSSAQLYAASLEIMYLSRRINIFFDFLYIVDALLCGMDW